MKILNHVFEASLSSRHPWSHFRVHKIRANRFGEVYGRHLVWGKLSVIFGQPHLVPIEVHKDCGGEVRNVGEDAISFCTECEHICEGDTEMITMEEFEQR